MRDSDWLATQKEEVARYRAAGKETHPVVKRLRQFRLAAYIEMAHEAFKLNDRPKILDVGCGGGNMLIRLARDGADCYGIDPLVEASLLLAIEKARAERVNIHLCCGVGESLPFGDESFDEVLFMSVIQSVQNQERCLQETKRVLKHEGLLLITVPSSRSIRTLFRWSKRTRDETMQYDFRTFSDILVNNGFEVLQMREREFHPYGYTMFLRMIYKVIGQRATVGWEKFANTLIKLMPMHNIASNMLALCQKNKSVEV